MKKSLKKEVETSWYLSKEYGFASESEMKLASDQLFIGLIEYQIAEKGKTTKTKVVRIFENSIERLDEVAAQFLRNINQLVTNDRFFKRTNPKRCIVKNVVLGSMTLHPSFPSYSVTLHIEYDYRRALGDEATVLFEVPGCKFKFQTPTVAVRPMSINPVYIPESAEFKAVDFVVEDD